MAPTWAVPRLLGIIPVGTVPFYRISSPKTTDRFTCFSDGRRNGQRQLRRPGNHQKTHQR